MMSATGVFCATSETTSLSAKTVHMLDMRTSPCQSRPRSQNSGSGSSSTRAMASMKRPVPAAHLSFMTKLATLPSASRLMTFESWPPMSMMARTSGLSQRAPRAWQVISVTDESVWPMPSRP